MSYQTPWSGIVYAGTYSITMASGLVYNGLPYVFSQWTDSGAITDGTTHSNPRTVVVSGDVTLVASYTQGQVQTITITLQAGPNGTVAGSTTLTIGQQYTFTATPNANYKVDHWDLNGTNKGSANSLALIAGTDILQGDVLTVFFMAIAPTSTNWSRSLPPDKYYITIAPTQGSYNFLHWNDGSTNPVAHLIDLTAASGPVTVTATYGPQTVPVLTISVNNSSGGTAAAAESPPYTLNEAVHVTAVAAPNFQFDGWLKDGQSAGNTNPYTITMEANHTLEANFSSISAPSLTVSVNNPLGGNTSANPTPPYTVNESVQVTAIPAVANGYKFDGWIKDGNPTLITDNPITVIMEANHTLTAQFSLITPITSAIPLVAAAGLGLLAVGVYIATRKKKR